MKRITSGAQSAYQGYEYQILVTVWVALFLMIKRQVTDHIEVEPASDEDIAADLAVPAERAVSTVAIAPGHRRLQIQVKLRCTPWTAGDFVSLLEGDVSSIATAKGAARRIRPLSMLEEDPAVQYLLVTSSGVSQTLSSYIVPEVGALSSAERLPGKGQRDKNAEIPSRIGILSEKSPELVGYQIAQILSEECLVPSLRLTGCIEGLKECVRNRLLGRTASVWTLQQMAEVLRRYDGLPGPLDADFVPPSNFDQLKSHIETYNCAIVVGPPGSGKTTTADYLAHSYRLVPGPYVVVSADEGPGYIRAWLRQPGKFLFYVQDPWGHGTLKADADMWVSELPKLLAMSGPDKRFLITSRFGVLGAAVGGVTPAWLVDNAIAITADHYDADRLWKILLHGLQNARPWQKDFVHLHRSQILKRLTLPYSVTIFARRLRGLETEDQAKLGALLSESGVEVVSQTVAREVSGLAWGAQSSAVTLWAALSLNQKVTEREARLLRSTVRAGNAALSVDMVKLLRWMVQAGWAEQSGDEYRVHPEVVAGLELILGEEPALAEDTMRALLSVLVEEGKVKQAFQVITHLSGRHIAIPPAAQEAINKYLLELVMTEDHGADLIQAFHHLQRWSTASDPASLLVRALRIECPEAEKGWGPLGIWQPPNWLEKDLSRVRSSESARKVAAMFIRWVLPDTNDLVGPELLEFFSSTLGWDLSHDFEQAAYSSLGHPTMNLDIIFAGALAGQDPPYDTILDQVFHHMQVAEGWWEKYKDTYQKAEQAQVDLARASNIMEEPTDRFKPLEDVLTLVVHIRRQREGFQWIQQSPHRNELLDAWAAAISPETLAGIGELQALLEACPKSDPRLAWKAIGRARCSEMASVLVAAMVEGPADYLVDCLQALFEVLSPQEITAHTAQLVPVLPFVRRAVLFHQSGRLEKTEDEKFRPHVQALRTILQADEKEALDVCSAALSLDQRGALHQRQAPAIETHLVQLASEAPLLLASEAVLALAISGKPVLNQVPRLLQSGEHLVRLRGLLAISLSDESEAVDHLRRGLTDPDYRCRRAAMCLLAEKEESTAVLEMASDPSAPVREACAAMIGQHQWAEGLPVLCSLLADRRDKNNDFFSTSYHFHVARQAADALAKFPSLPSLVSAKLLDFLGGGSQSTKDPVVLYKLMLALASRPVDGILPLLLRYLMDLSRLEGTRNAGFPLRYAAAWGLAYHLAQNVESRSEVPVADLGVAASHSDGRLAGPALLALGLLGRRALPTVHDVLRGEEITPERAILAAAACSMGGASLSLTVLSSVVPRSHPGLRILGWAQRQPTVDEPAWQALLADDEEVRAWVAEIQPASDVNPVLRLALCHLFGGRVSSHLDSSDRYKHDLAESTEMLTFHTMFGGE